MKTVFDKLCSAGWELMDLLEQKQVDGRETLEAALEDVHRAMSAIAQLAGAKQ